MTLTIATATFLNEDANGNISDIIKLKIIIIIKYILDKYVIGYLGPNLISDYSADSSLKKKIMLAVIDKDCSLPYHEMLS